MGANANVPLRRPARQRIDGVLLLDKPIGLSSNAALQRVRRLFNAAKAGHTGTLDPLASGLLPVCFGDATKFSQALLDSRKGYRALVRFGVATDTLDAEGAVVERGRSDFDGDAVASMLSRFVGAIEQVPPRHAALKRDGRPYYEYARANVEIERTARPVTIDALTLVDWSPPDATIDVTCSKGTYVRVLADDFGRALGTCAHLAGLRRTATGGFLLHDAITLDALEALELPARIDRLLPVDAPLADLPAVTLDGVTATALSQGRRPAHDAPPGRYRGYGPAGFVGLIEATGTDLRAVRLVVVA
jgi:tRNA pseudouridine55 synthase